VIKHLFARDEQYIEELFTPVILVAFLMFYFLIAVVTTGSAYPAGASTRPHSSST
jgi:hypothetical protein